MPDWLLAILLALLGTTGGIIGSRYGRLTTLETRLDHLEQGNRALWMYSRQLIDHIWADRGAPPPNPPDTIAGDFQFPTPPQKDTP